MWMLSRSRLRLAGVLNAAYAEGLLSENTHAHRLALLFEDVVDPQPLVGDLTLRASRYARTAAGRRAWSALLETLRGVLQLHRNVKAPVLLLALDRGERHDLLIGRDLRCDVCLQDPTVSRRHAHLTFRDGSWVLRDLSSKNGTWVNGRRVGRIAVRAGDELVLGEQVIELD